MTPAPRGTTGLAVCSVSPLAVSGPSGDHAHASTVYSSPLLLFPLSCSLLVDSSTVPVLLYLAFNYAVWRYRNPAEAARKVESADWLVNRLVESAQVQLASVKVPKRKPKNAAKAELSVSEHDTIISHIEPDIALGDLVNTLVAAHHSVAFNPVHLDADT